MEAFIVANNNNVFVLNDGTKEILVNNQFGQEICKLHIRTGDIGIVDRFDKFTSDFDEIVEPLKEVSIKRDGTPSDEEFDNGWKIIKAVEKELINRINSIFDMQDAENLFVTRNAFSSVDGKFYVEHVIDLLGKIVMESIEEESKKTEDRLKKYTSDIKRDAK